MQSYTFEFENEHDLRETAGKLLDDLDVTGEVNIRPLGDGRWRMEVNSERELREATLSKLKGYKQLTVATEGKVADVGNEEAAASSEA